MIIDSKKEALIQQLDAMSAKSNVTESVYSSEMIIRAFVYFATSRALYRNLRNDYQLPSISTLTHLTSAVSKVDEQEFVQRVFQKLDGDEKLSMILHDEVYVKKMLLYSGGTLIGKSADNPSKLARTKEEPEGRAQEAYSDMQR